jgi:RNA recognition motif-containing protein
VFQELPRIQVMPPFECREMRGVRPKGIAFVEFDDELKATHCLNEMNNQYFHGVQLSISYQNK